MRKPIVSALAAAQLVLLAACAVGPDYHRPAMPSEGGFVPGPDATVTASVEGKTQQFDRQRTPVANWWHDFGSVAVDTAVTEAETGNPGVQAAQASLRRSLADLQAGYGVFYPAASAGGGVSRQRGSPQRQDEDLPGSIFSVFTLSTSVSYALDVFGGERRAVEGLRAQTELQRQQLRAAQLSLEANVVNAMIARAAYAAQTEASEAVVASLREQVSIATVRANSGIAPYSDALALEAQLDAVETQLPALHQRQDQAGHLLATLCGRAPGQWPAPDLQLSDVQLPGVIPIGLPSALLERRPDILASEAQLRGASAAIGVATAAMLPSITITGGYGASSFSADKLLSAGSSVWSVGAALATPAFEGGTLWFQRRAAVASYEQSEALYRQTVLGAFEQVADALRALQHDAEALDAQQRQLAAAQDAWRLVQANYAAGTVAYLDVLVADAAYHQALIGCLQARALRLQDTVALFAALGGGWQEQPPASVAGGG